MVWNIKLRSPEDIGTRSLDVITVPREYAQTIPARITRAQGYPYEGRQCLVSVKLIGTLTVQEYRDIYGRTAIRSQYQGTWSAWMDDGKVVA